MDTIQFAIAQLNQSDIHFLRNEPLKLHSTFKVGGPALFFISANTIQEITCAIQIAGRCGLPFFILGEGSNVVFSSKGYYGFVIYIGGLNNISVEGCSITAQAGARLWDVCIAARDHSLCDLCFGYGIPGSIGGAIFMNAGAFDGEMKLVTENVQYLSEEGIIQNFTASEMQFGYRTSIFQSMKGCILSAKFVLEHGEKEAICTKMEDFWERRKEKQPLDMPSAGSAFKRPPGAFAGALIDQCGLRGYRIGDAAISQKHCGFIVNLGNATSEDIVLLAETVSRIVKEKTGYVLEREIKIIPPDGKTESM